MKVKRLISASLCVILAGTVMSCGKDKQAAIEGGDYSGYDYHETGYPIVDKPLTLKVVAKRNALHGDWDQTYWGKYAEEKTGIKLDIEYIDKSAWNQKIQLMFASGNLPDVIIGGGNGLSKLDEISYGVESGLIIPLNDLIDKHAPDISQMFVDKPAVKAEVTAPDGNIYTLPSTRRIDEVSGGVRVWTNEQWLSNLGIERPKTISEFHDMLYKFRDSDPDGNGKDDTYAISGVYDDAEGDLKRYIMCAFGMLDDDFYIKDEKVVFGALQPNFKEYLKEMEFLYSEGLIDRDYFTQTMTEYKAKSSTGKVGMGVWSAPTAGGGMDKETADQYAWMSALTSDVNDIEMWARNDSVCSTGHFAITKDCKYPEAAIRWANIWYTEEGGIVAECGAQYGTYEGQPKFGWELFDNGEWASRNDTGEPDNWTAFNRWMGPAADNCAFGYRPVFSTKKKNATVGKFYEALASNDKYYFNGKEKGVKALPSAFYFSKEEQEEMALVLTEARSYVKQQEAKFITGAEPLENFDDFVEKLKGYKIEGVIEKYQKAYDEYKEKM